jgi:membrane protease YdiL (CAAX protease family)
MTERPLHPPLPPEPPRARWLRPALVSPWAEFLLVAALALALPIRNSTVAALDGSSSRFVQMLLSNNRLLEAIFFEAAFLALFLFYLHRRGWKPADFRISLGWWTSAQGVALLVVTEVAAIATLFILLAATYALQTRYSTFLSFVFSMSPHLERHSIHLSWPVIVVAMIVNAFFEELICMGYIFNQLAARRGPLTALVVTVFLRAACHTYQDPVHLAGIVVLFSIYGIWYWRTGRLWPLIFAHLLLDLGSVSAIKLLFS